MHQALYRKWRPAGFDDVCGQEHITSILRYEVISGKISHAYLFCGSRGTGKTTCAKILAKAANCLSPENGSPCGKCEACRAIEAGAATDILEMDAASNTGVDYIRDIRDEVVYTPSMLKTRVYIIDEVHMLSNGAFNALLKTLEEPPPQVIFILATTEPHKIPATILSRCQRFDFRRISSRVIAERLMLIAKNEAIELDADAAQLIAKLSQGGMRDAISLLELCAGEGKRIAASLVGDTAGVVGRGSIERVIRAVLGRDYEEIFKIIDELYSSSKDISVFWQDLTAYYRDIMVFKSVRDPSAYLDLTDSEAAQLSEIAQCFRMETLIEHTSMLDDAFMTISNARTAAAKRLSAELALVRMSNGRLSSTPQSLLARISALEDKIAMSGFTATVTAPKTAEPPDKADGRAQNDAAAQTAQSNRTSPASYSPEPPESGAQLKNERVPASQKVMRQLGCWQDAVAKLAAYDPMASSFLNGSKAYRCENDGKIMIVFDAAMKMKMMSNDESRRQIAGILNTFEPDGSVIAPQDIAEGCAEKKGDDGEYSYIDEIIERKDEKQ